MPQKWRNLPALGSSEAVKRIFSQAFPQCSFHQVDLSPKTDLFFHRILRTSCPRFMMVKPQMGQTEIIIPGLQEFDAEIDISDTPPRQEPGAS